MIKPSVVVGAALLVAAALGLVMLARRVDPPAPGASAPDSLSAAEPERRPEDLQADSGFLGVVFAQTSVELSAKFDTRVESVDVRTGDRFKRNQRLATLDVRASRQDLAIAEAALDAAKAEQQQAELEVADTRARAERLTRLADLVSAEQAATGRYQAERAAARDPQVRAQAAEREARVNQLREIIRDGVIVAPFDGVVAVRYLDPGVTVAPGTPILRVINLGGLMVRFAVPDGRAAEVAVGRAVTVNVEAPRLALPAVVTSIAPEIDNALQMLVAEATVTVDPATQRRVPAGVAARVMPGPSNPN